MIQPCYIVSTVDGCLNISINRNSQCKPRILSRSRTVAIFGLEIKAQIVPDNCDVVMTVST